MFNLSNDFDKLRSISEKRDDVSDLFKVEPPDLDSHFDFSEENLFSSASGTNRNENVGFFKQPQPPQYLISNKEKQTSMKNILNIINNKTPFNNSPTTCTRLSDADDHPLNKSPENLLLKTGSLFDRYVDSSGNFLSDVVLINNNDQQQQSSSTSRFGEGSCSKNRNQSHAFNKPYNPQSNSCNDNSNNRIQHSNLISLPQTFSKRPDDNSSSRSGVEDNGLFNFVLGTMARKSKDSIFHKMPSTENNKVRRKFPGPAGTLPKLSPGQNIDDVSLKIGTKAVATLTSHNKSSDSSVGLSSTQQHQSQSQALASQLDDKCSFSSSLWTAAISDLDDVCPALFHLLDRFSLSTVYKRVKNNLLPNYKVPVVCAMVESITKHADDATIYLKDPSGTLQGAVHRKIIDDYADKIHVGCVMIMKQVAVYYPKYSRKCYLNLTPNNLIRIYSRPLDTSSYIPGHMPTFTNGLTVTKIQDDNFSDLYKFIERIIKSPEYEGEVGDNPSGIIGMPTNHVLWDVGCLKDIPATFVATINQKNCNPINVTTGWDIKNNNYNNNNNNNNNNTNSYNNNNSSSISGKSNYTYSNIPTNATTKNRCCINLSCSTSYGSNVNHNHSSSNSNISGNNNINNSCNMNNVNININYANNDRISVSNMTDNNNNNNDVSIEYDTPPEILDDWILEDDMDGINLNELTDSNQNKTNYDDNSNNVDAIGDANFKNGENDNDNLNNGGNNKCGDKVNEVDESMFDVSNFDLGLDDIIEGDDDNNDNNVSNGLNSGCAGINANNIANVENDVNKNNKDNDNKSNNNNDKRNTKNFDRNSVSAVEKSNNFDSLFKINSPSNEQTPTLQLSASPYMQHSSNDCTITANTVTNTCFDTTTSMNTSASIGSNVQKPIKHSSHDGSSSQITKSQSKRPKFVVPVLKNPSTQSTFLKKESDGRLKSSGCNPVNDSSSSAARQQTISQTSKSTFVFNKNDNNTSTQGLFPSAHDDVTPSQSQNIFDTQVSLITRPPSPRPHYLTDTMNNTQDANNFSPLLQSNSNFLDRMVPIERTNSEDKVEDLLNGLESELMDDFY